MMWILKFKDVVLARGTKSEMEKELADLLSVCIIEENKNKFLIIEDSD